MSIKEGDVRSRADSGRLASTSASRRDAALTGGLPSGARGDGSYAARPEAAAPSGSSRGAGHGGPPLQRGTSRGSSSADPGVLPALHPEWTAATTVRTRRGGDARAPGAVTGALRPAGLPLVPALPPGEQAVRERALVPRSGHNDGSEVVVQEDPALADALAYSINMETAEELERQRNPGIARELARWLTCRNTSEAMQALKETIVTQCYSSAATRQRDRERAEVRFTLEARKVSKEAEIEDIARTRGEKAAEETRAKHLRTVAARERALRQAQGEVVRAQQAAMTSTEAVALRPWTDVGKQQAAATECSVM